MPSSEGDFVQVDETDVAYQKQGTTQTDLLKEAEQKLQYLEAYQKNIRGKLVFIFDDSLIIIKICWNIDDTETSHTINFVIISISGNWTVDETEIVLIL